MRTASRPQLWFSDHGEGEPVLFITGWTISSAVFDPVLEHYAGRVRIIAYDHRGSGRSAPWPAPVSMAMLAADAARVLDERGVASAHVMGVSMGAMVALELAVRMPERVKSLVLIGGTPGGPASSIPPLPQTAQTLGRVVADTVRHRRWWPAAVLVSPAARRDEPEHVRRLVAPFGRHRPPPWTVQFQTFATSCFTRRGDLHRVRAPTLVLHGSEDVMSPLRNATDLAAGIPGAELHVERGAGHAVPLERPERSARILLDWVARHADVVPPERGPADRVGEVLSRPFSLHAGAWRASRELGPAVWRRVTGGG